MSDLNNTEALSVAFKIDLSDTSKCKRPRRFDNNTKISSINLSKDDLEKKQVEANNRRLDFQKKKIARIHERSEDCRKQKLDKKVQILLQQDALRKQLPGSETIKPLPPSQMSKTIHSVANCKM